jgi:hypothetical protein
MKIAIQNPFAGQLVAETELSRRLYRAASNLGWQAAEVHTAAEIRSIHPDFVIALHNNSPKLAEFPTYGCMWNPPSFFEGTEPFVQHVLTYDGYLTSSIVLERWLHQLLYPTPKRYFTAPFYTSCPQTVFRPPDLAQPHLMYLGSNWDGPRFQALFAGLDEREFMQVYGNPVGWTHLRSAYRGPLPYDGEMVLKALHQAGVGLCLHRAEHRQAALPSMRIFEIVAAGAVALCSEHPFIRSAFGDTVLYFDPDRPIPEQLQQIDDQMQWIRSHPQTAIEMAAAAHQIFASHYTLETLLQGILPQHQALLARKGFVRTEPAQPTVELLLRVSQPEALPALLAQVAQQTYTNLSVTVISSQPQSEPLPLESPLDRPLKRLHVSPDADRSTGLWQGLNAIEADYFALLDETGLLYPNHLHTLVALLEQHPEAGVAYAGSLSTESPLPEESNPVSSPIAQFQPFQLERFLRFEQPIAPHSFLSRRSLLDATLLQDPQLNEHDILCLLFHLAQRSRFLFSYELTCEQFTWPLAANTLRQQYHDWDSELSRFKFIFWHQEFAPGASLQSLHQPDRPDYDALQSRLNRQQAELKRLRQQCDHLQLTRDQLQTAESTIAAMQTSKFWQLRSAWFRVKRAIGLPTD